MLEKENLKFAKGMFKLVKLISVLRINLVEVTIKFARELRF